MFVCAIRSFESCVPVGSHSEAAPPLPGPLTTAGALCLAGSLPVEDGASQGGVMMPHEWGSVVWCGVTVFVLTGGAAVAVCTAVCRLDPRATAVGR